MAEVVGKLIDCSICMDELSDPRFLPCHHTFCFDCIEELRSSNQTRMAAVPCPLCRSSFNSPAASLRKNDYAEELVNMTRDSEETARERAMLSDELEALRTELEESEGALVEATEETRRQNAALTETRSRLVELEDHSSQVEQRLQSRVEELERNLAAAESRELCLRDQHHETMEKLVDAERRYEATKIEAETCRRAKNEREESLAKVRQSCRNLRQQLQQTQQEASQQLKDAERQQERTRLEAESCQIATNNVEACLSEAKQKCRSLRQEKRKLQRESSEQVKALEEELSHSKQDIIRLNKQLAMERLNLEQHEDYKKSHAEVVRLCFVLLLLLLMSVTGALILLEDRSRSSVRAKETQLIACNNLAERLEDRTMKLTGARYEIRDALRMRNDCSEQLTATKHALSATEIKLKDTNDVLNRTKADKCKQTKAASNSGTEKDSGCIRQLAEAQSSLRAKETTLRNVSSHLTQEHKAKISAAATAEECSLHRKWLQQRLEEYMVLLSQDSVAKGELVDTKKRGCNCEDTNPCFHATESGKDKSTNLIEKVVIPYSSTEKDGNCTQELKEARADLKTQKVVSRNCSRHLAEERKNKTKATATADACARQLKDSRYSLELKTSTLSKCSTQLKEARKKLTSESFALERCTNDLSASKMERASAGVNQRDSAKLKDVLAKLTKCSEELATAGETVRWNTKQHNKCAENLVASRGEVQVLTTRLSDTEFSCDRIVQDLKRRHRDSLADLKLRYKLEMEREAQRYAADDDEQTLVNPIKIFLVALIMEGYLWLMGITCILFLWFAYYVIRNKFHTLMGIRSGHIQYRYGVNFRRRYR